jgi:hypothetical protein
VAAAGLLTGTAMPRLLAMTRSGDAMLRAQALQVRQRVAAFSSQRHC